MGTISEANNVPYLVKPGDHQAGVDGDSVFMGRPRYASSNPKTVLA